MKLFLFFVLLPTVSLAREVPHNRRTPQITPPEEWKPDLVNNKEVKVEADDSISTYIISGTPANPGQFPWQALLIIDKRVLCGGSLISDTYVLTAAHCLDGYSTVDVYLGNNKYPQDGENSTTTSSSITIHENYASLVNDIGLVSFQKIEISDNISPVRLPTQSYQHESLVGSLVVATGFGRTSDSSDNLSDTLLYVSLKVISNSLCKSYFNVALPFDESVICTSGTSSNPTASPCNGDSGGALIIKAADGIYTQVGIVSFGSSNGCALQYPAVFTRVSNYLDWIHQKTNIPII